MASGPMPVWSSELVGREDKGKERKPPAKNKYGSSDSSDLLAGGSKSAPRCGGGQEGMADLWKWHGHAELAPCPRGGSR